MISMTFCFPRQAGMSVHCVLSHQVKITTVCMMESSMPTSSDARVGSETTPTVSLQSPCPRLHNTNSLFNRMPVCMELLPETIKLSKRLDFFPPLRFPYTQLSASIYFFKPTLKCQCIQSGFKMHTLAHNLDTDSEEIQSPEEI